jgi:type VI protein secretion system component VasF
MTTARQAAPRAGYRHQRRLDKQRRFREELLAVGFLLLVLLATVVLLGLQWLHGGQSSTGAGIPLLHATAVWAS